MIKKILLGRASVPEIALFLLTILAAVGAAGLILPKVLEGTLAWSSDMTWFSMVVAAGTLAAVAVVMISMRFDRGPQILGMLVCLAVAGVLAYLWISPDGSPDAIAMFGHPVEYLSGFGKTICIGAAAGAIIFAYLAVQGISNPAERKDDDRDYGFAR
jgi:hypothetical protein